MKITYRLREDSIEVRSEYVPIFGEFVKIGDSPLKQVRGKIYHVVPIGDRFIHEVEIVLEDRETIKNLT